jgi:hypothetical protein
MDTHEAARILGVAAYEVLAVRHDAEGWWAHYEDMASHIRIWRHIPSWQLATADASTVSVQADAGEAGPDVAPDSPQEVATGPAVDTDGDGVPEGTSAQILKWVGSDSDRAERALAAEAGRDKPRGVLTAALEKLAT